MSAAPPPSLVLFSHCGPRVVVGVRVPPLCPLCGASLGGAPLPEPPVSLRAPLSSAHSSPHQLAVRPTRGAFLTDYHEGVDLHVGISDSQGGVYHFWEGGVSRDACGWGSCVCVPLRDCIAPQGSGEPWGAWGWGLGGGWGAGNPLWDSHLEAMAQSAEWSSESYEELGHNCFDFALAFLALVQQRLALPAWGSPTEEPPTEEPPTGCTQPTPRERWGEEESGGRGARRRRSEEGASDSASVSVNDAASDAVNNTESGSPSNSASVPGSDSSASVPGRERARLRLVERVLVPATRRVSRYLAVLAHVLAHGYYLPPDT
ncbi:unnamed protein product [Lampetra fluviatilis]